MRGMDIRQLVAEFTERLHAAVDQISVARARDAVMHALGEKRGRLPKGMAAILGRKPRRKGPRQLCPVPGCQNPAAPVFGMVCAQHKDVSRTKIKQYREARRAAKLSAKDAAAGASRGGAKRSGAPASRRAAKTDGAARRAAKNPAGAAKPARPSKTARRAAPRKAAPVIKAPAADKTAAAARMPKGDSSPPVAAASQPASAAP
jgi:hypothetical protein